MLQLKKDLNLMTSGSFKEQQRLSLGGTPKGKTVT